VTTAVVNEKLYLFCEESALSWTQYCRVIWWGDLFPMSQTLLTDLSQFINVSLYSRSTAPSDQEIGKSHQLTFRVRLEFRLQVKWMLDQCSVLGAEDCFSIFGVRYWKLVISFLIEVKTSQHRHDLLVRSLTAMATPGWLGRITHFIKRWTAWTSVVRPSAIVHRTAATWHVLTAWNWIVVKRRS